MVEPTAVLEMLEEIHKKWILTPIWQKPKTKDAFRLMGFGHRVYSFDPRAQITKKSS
jgi:citrate synthase